MSGKQGSHHMGMRPAAIATSRRQRLRLNPDNGKEEAA